MHGWRVAQHAIILKTMTNILVGKKQTNPKKHKQAKPQIKKPQTNLE